MNREGASRDKALYHLFSNNYKYYGQHRQPTKIKVIRYNNQKIETEDIPTDRTEYKSLVKPGYVNWIQVNGMADSELISRIILGFGLLPIDCKSVLTPFHAAKIDVLNNRLIIIMRSCSFEKKGHVSSEHIALLSKDNFVITFREKNGPLFKPVEDSINNDVMSVRGSTRVMLVAFLLNAVFSETIDSAIRVEDLLESLDDQLLDSHQSKIIMGKMIQQCRHANLILQKNNVPLHAEFRNIAESDLITSDKEMMQIFDELYNQLDFIVLTSKNSREMLASMRDLYASNNELRTNAIMKRLTIVSTLFIPITFLVGLWGMNFKLMPELDWQYGYPAALIVLFLTAVLTWEYMKRNHWF